MAHLQRRVDPAAPRQLRLDVAAAARVQLDVPPPGLHGVDTAAAEVVVQRGEVPGLPRQVHGRPAPGGVRQQAFEVPGAGLHAAAAHAAAGIGQAVARALLGVGLPDLVAVDHHLGPGRDRPGRALAGALGALLAEALQPEVDRPVVRHRHVGGDRPALQPRAEERVEDHLADAADLAQTAEQQQRGLQHVAVQHRVDAGAVAQPPDLLGEDAAQQGEAQVGPHALRDADPVVAAGSLHGLVALVDQQVHRMGVVGRQRMAPGVVRVVGPGGHRAQADRVAAEVIGGRLQAQRVVRRVERRRRHRSARLAELQQQQRAQRAPGAGPDRALHHVVGVARGVLHVAPEVAEQGPGEEVGPLGEARHALVVDERRRLVLALQRLEGVRPGVEVAPGVGVLVVGALQRAQAQLPGGTVRAPAVLPVRGRQRQVGLELTGGRHRGEPVAAPEVGVAQVLEGQAAGNGQAVQADLAAGGGVRARFEAEHAQVAGQQHGGLCREHGRPVWLGAGQPVAARLAGTRVAREFHQHHQCGRVMGHRAALGACRRDHVGQDHVHAGSEAARLRALQLGRDAVDLEVAQRLVQQGLRRYGADAHHRGVEVVAGGLQVARAFPGVCRDFRKLRGVWAVAHDVEHADVGRHRMGDRQRVGDVEGQRQRAGHAIQRWRDRRARQALQRVGPEVDGSVAVGEQAHGSCRRGASGTLPSCRQDACGRRSAVPARRRAARSCVCARRRASRRACSRSAG